LEKYQERVQDRLDESFGIEKLKGFFFCFQWKELKIDRNLGHP
jgi:hypothetical protein